MKSKQTIGTQIGDKLKDMSYYESLAFIRDGIASTFGFLPKAYAQSFTALLDKLENDYKKVETERDAAIAERDAAIAEKENLLNEVNPIKDIKEGE